MAAIPYPKAPTPYGSFTWLDISAATVVKATSGVVVNVNVITAGTTVGTVNDVATTGGAAVTNQVASLPNVVGSYRVGMPCATGIVIVPGSGQVVAVSFD